jgi:hypothetical protein
MPRTTAEVTALPTAAVLREQRMPRQQPTCSDGTEYRRFDEADRPIGKINGAARLMVIRRPERYRARPRRSASRRACRRYWRRSPAAGLILAFVGVAGASRHQDGGHHRPQLAHHADANEVGFAANLGTMLVSDEISALQTLGIPPMEFLVLPRIVALVMMMMPMPPKQT